MLTNREIVGRQLQPILEWLKNRGDAAETDVWYGDVRRTLMDRRDYEAGPAAEAMSRLDTVMDAFEATDERAEWKSTSLRGLRSMQLSRLCGRSAFWVSQGNLTSESGTEADWK